MTVHIEPPDDISSHTLTRPLVYTRSCRFFKIVTHWNINDAIQSHAFNIRNHFNHMKCMYLSRNIFKSSSMIIIHTPFAVHQRSSNNNIKTTNHLIRSHKTIRSKWNGWCTQAALYITRTN